MSYSKFLIAVLVFSFTALAQVPENLIQNGSFEEGHNLTDQNRALFSQLPHWSQNETLGGEFRLHKGTSGTSPSDGIIKAELDGKVNASLEQTVSVKLNKEYILFFDYAPREVHENDNILKLYLNDVLVKTVQEQTYGWKTVSFEFTATTDIAKLSFQGVGDGILKKGALLDNVRLYEKIDYERLGTNLVGNGSFELNHNLEDGSSGFFDEVLPWRAVAHKTRVPFEVQYNNTSKILPTDGTVKVELDARKNAGLYQNITTVIGESYTLKVDYAPKRHKKGETNTVEVLIDGVKIADLLSSQKGWQTYTFTHIATNEQTRLEFRGGGTSDKLGGLIDNIHFLNPANENITVNHSFEEGHTSDGKKRRFLHSIPGWTSVEMDNVTNQIEIQKGLRKSGISPQNGLSKLDLDSKGNAKVLQDIATEIDSEYLLSFYYSPRDLEENTNDIEVLFNNNVIGIISNTVKSWKRFEFLVTANSTESSLSFRGIGESDKRGGLVDSIRFQKLTPKPPAVTSILSIEHNPAQGFVKYILGNSSSTEGNIVSYTLNLYQEGQLIGALDTTNAEGYYSFVSPGVYEVDAIARDEHGNFASSEKIEITITNSVPTTVFTLSPVEGLPNYLKVDFTGTYDQDGNNIVLYRAMIATADGIRDVYSEEPIFNIALLEPREDYTLIFRAYDEAYQWGQAASVLSYPYSGAIHPIEVSHYLSSSEENPVEKYVGAEFTSDSAITNYEYRAIHEDGEVVLPADTSVQHAKIVLTKPGLWTFEFKAVDADGHASSVTTETFNAQWSAEDLKPFYRSHYLTTWEDDPRVRWIGATFEDFDGQVTHYRYLATHSDGTQIEATPGAIQNQGFWFPKKGDWTISITATDNDGHNSDAFTFVENIAWDFEKPTANVTYELSDAAYPYIYKVAQNDTYPKTVAKSYLKAIHLDGTELAVESFDAFPWIDLPKRGTWRLEYIAEDAFGIKSDPFLHEVTIPALSLNAQLVAISGEYRKYSLDAMGSTDSFNGNTNLSFNIKATSSSETLNFNGITHGSEVSLGAGLWSINIQGIDQWGRVDGNISQSITVENLKPVASFTASPSDSQWNLVTLDASASQDLDGEVVQYEYTITDSAGNHNTFSTTHSFLNYSFPPIEGEFQISLVVYDNDGLVSEVISNNVSVYEHDPLKLEISCNPGYEFKLDCLPLFLEDERNDLTYSWTINGETTFSTKNISFDVSFNETYQIELVASLNGRSVTKERIYTIDEQMEFEKEPSGISFVRELILDSYFHPASEDVAFTFDPIFFDETSTLNLSFNKKSLELDHLALATGRFSFSTEDIIEGENHLVISGLDKDGKLIYQNIFFYAGGVNLSLASNHENTSYDLFFLSDRTKKAVVGQQSFSNLPKGKVIVIAKSALDIKMKFFDLSEDTSYEFMLFDNTNVQKADYAFSSGNNGWFFEHASSSVEVKNNVITQTDDETLDIYPLANGILRASFLTNGVTNSYLNMNLSLLTKNSGGVAAILSKNITSGEYELEFINSNKRTYLPYTSTIDVFGAADVIGVDLLLINNLDEVTTFKKDADFKLNFNLLPKAYALAVPSSSGGGISVQKIYASEHYVSDFKVKNYNGTLLDSLSLGDYVITAYDGGVWKSSPFKPKSGVGQNPVKLSLKSSAVQDLKAFLMLGKGSVIDTTSSFVTAYTKRFNASSGLLELDFSLPGSLMKDFEEYEHATFVVCVEKLTGDLINCVYSGGYEVLRALKVDQRFVYSQGDFTKGGDKYVSHTIYDELQYVLDTYKTELTNVKFKINDCNRLNGGEFLPHRSHKSSRACDIILGEREKVLPPPAGSTEDVDRTNYFIQNLDLAEKIGSFFDIADGFFTYNTGFTYLNFEQKTPVTKSRDYTLFRTAIKSSCSSDTGYLLEDLLNNRADHSDHLHFFTSLKARDKRNVNFGVDDFISAMTIDFDVFDFSLDRYRFTIDDEFVGRFYLTAIDKSSNERVFIEKGDATYYSVNLDLFRDYKVIFKGQGLFKCNEFDLPTNLFSFHSSVNSYMLNKAIISISPVGNARPRINMYSVLKEDGGDTILDNKIVDFDSITSSQDIKLKSSSVGKVHLFPSNLSISIPADETYGFDMSIVEVNTTSKKVKIRYTFSEDAPEGEEVEVVLRERHYAQALESAEVVDVQTIEVPSAGSSRQVELVYDAELPQYITENGQSVQTKRQFVLNKEITLPNVFLYDDPNSNYESYKFTISGNSGQYAFISTDQISYTYSVDGSTVNGAASSSLELGYYLSGSNVVINKKTNGENIVQSSGEVFYTPFIFSVTGSKDVYLIHRDSYNIGDVSNAFYIGRFNNVIAR